MSNSRRNSLGRLAAGAALAGGAVGASPGRLGAEPGPRPVSDTWDMSWRDRINGEFRGVFDSPKIDEGGEIFRAAIRQSQVTEVYGAKDEDVNSVLVPGIILQPSGFFALLEAQRAGCHLFAAGE